MTSVKELRKAYHANDVNLSRREGEKAQLQQSLQSEIDRQLQLETDKNLSEKAGIFLMNVLNEKRKTGIETIEKIVTASLEMVIGPGHRLFFETNEEKRQAGKKNFKMSLKVASPYEDDGEELITGLSGSLGGGLQELVAFALLFAALEWLGYTGPIILDEAFHFMSNDGKLDLVASFLQKFSQQTGRQVIFATHKGELEQIGDKIFRVNKVKGKSVVITLKTGEFYQASIEGV